MSDVETAAPAAVASPIGRAWNVIVTAREGSERRLRRALGPGATNRHAYRRAWSED